MYKGSLSEQAFVEEVSEKLNSRRRDLKTGTS